MPRKYRITLLIVLASWLPTTYASENFVAFESEQFRPLSVSPDGQTLYAVNTPDNRIEVYSLSTAGLKHEHSIPVGMEPVAIAALNNSTVWVANHLSDSVSIIDVSANLGLPRVIRTLLVGDEPRDIVFASGKAFITTAHRGQNSPYTDPDNPMEMTTEGIGRADVWVFDVNDTGADMGGTPLTILSLFGDTPGPMAVSPDGTRVYVGVFKSGNQTSIVTSGVVCPGGSTAEPCIRADGEMESPGGVPAPSENIEGLPIPRGDSGLIVKFDGENWRDVTGRDWNNMIRFDLPDLDVFELDATQAVPVETQAFPSVGTVLFSMAVHPTNGRVFVANTDARNDVRFEKNVRGHIHETRVTILNPDNGTVRPRHLNKHIDYGIIPSPAGTREHSLAYPKGIVISPDGQTTYVAAKGSGKIGVFRTSELQQNTFAPNADDHILLTGGGPSGMAVDPTRDRLYVLTRFDNGISIIDTNNRSEIAHVTMPNPEPESVVAGRPLHYDANFSSSNGEAACASCHIGGDKDELAWDLGDPDGLLLLDPNPRIGGCPFGGCPSTLHPMKGPMMTQTVRGMAGQGPMHWRGDRSGGFDPGGDPMDEEAAFRQFNPAFVTLMGRTSQLTDEEMQALSDFTLQIVPPPNPVRNLDDSLNPRQQAGSNHFNNQANCDSCHAIDRDQGFHGSRNEMGFAGGTELRKIPHYRNLYEKVGMFGRPNHNNFRPTTEEEHGHTGPQVRGYGYSHDGKHDTLVRFHRGPGFFFPGGDEQRLDVSVFIVATETVLQPIVGQQITLDADNAMMVADRITLLTDRALANDADLVVQGVINGKQRGWLLQPSGMFRPDRDGDEHVDTDALMALSQTPGQQITFTAVPPGSGERIALDRNEDDVLNGDEYVQPIASGGSSSAFFHPLLILLWWLRRRGPLKSQNLTVF
jgi:YVTN family beta-propeller protein